MATITTVETLRDHYGEAKKRSLEKQLTRLEKHSRQFISLSPFVLLGTASAKGYGDVSPRGETPGFVQVIDDNLIALPDRPGNNRLDSLSNIVENSNVSLLFLIPGVDETLRLNGIAEIRNDADLLERFEVKGRLPTTVLLVTVKEVYLHCAKALMRSNLWALDSQIAREELPTMGQMIRDQVNSTDPLEAQQDMLKRYKQALY